MADEDVVGGIDIEYFMEDISEEPSTRVAGAILIIVSFLSPFEVLVTILDSDLF